MRDEVSKLADLFSEMEEEDLSVARAVVPGDLLNWMRRHSMTFRGKLWGVKIAEGPYGEMSVEAGPTDLGRWKDVVRLAWVPKITLRNGRRTRNFRTVRGVLRRK